MVTETAGTTGIPDEVTRFLGLQVVVGLDNNSDGRTATVHFEHNGTCGVVGYPDRDNQQLARYAAAQLRVVADGMDAVANNPALWQDATPPAL